MQAPRRAHSIVISAGGDTAEDLAHELEFIATRIRMGKVEEGCGGGVSSSSIYQYRARPDQTHSDYFRQVAEYLRAKKEVA